MTANATNDADKKKSCPVGSLLTKGAGLLFIYSAPARVQTAERQDAASV